MDHWADATHGLEWKGACSSVVGFAEQFSDLCAAVSVLPPREVNGDGFLLFVVVVVVVAW